MKKKLIILIFSIFYIIVNSSQVFSEIIEDVIIKGNQRIDSETIIEYGKIKKNQNYSGYDLNVIQKKIFDTGFFKNINLILEKNKLYIDVVENPLVDFFNIQGEKRNDQLNKLYDQLKLGPNKIYSEYLLKKDLETIKDLYISQGYSNIEVVPRISILENNKINILITLNLNEQQKINKIYFIGDKKFSSSDLLSIVSSEENGWWKFLSSNTIVNNERILYDKELLKRFYLNNGYYDVQISSVDIKKINNDRIDIIFSINSGKIYNFGDFKVTEGINFLSDKTKNFINLSKTKYLINKYSLNNITKFQKEVNEYFSKNKIDFTKIEVIETKNIDNIDIDAKILSTKKLYINKINVTGNTITEEEVIRRNLNFSEGDSYSDYREKISLDNLRSLNIFKKVDIKSENVENNKIDLTVSITEQPTGMISAGAGYGGNGGNIGFQVQEANFLGKGITLNSDLNLGTQRIEGSVGLSIPDFINSDKTLYSRIFSTKTTFSNTLYESKKLGFELSTGYEIFENIKFKPGIASDVEKIDVQSNASSYFIAQDGSYLTQKFLYNIDKDVRDNKVGTKKGYIIGFGQQLATPLSDIPYLKNSIYGTNFFSVTDKSTLKLKYGYSNITSLNNNDIKLSDRLFVPYYDIKGFEARGFGPKDVSSNEFIGGNNTLYSSGSITFPNPLEDSWKLNSFVFLNAAKVWGVDNSNASDSDKIRSAFGVGIDWRSPLGPLNINFAKTITKEESDRTKVFSVEIGSSF